MNSQTIELAYDLEDFSTLVQNCRSIRRFDESDPIERGLVLEFINLARQTASANNAQRLRFKPVTAAAERAALFSQLGWAARFPDWPGPAQGERPTAYIVICTLGPAHRLRHIDLGIAAQTIALAATQASYGACVLQNFSAAAVSDALQLPAEATPQLVIALGRPAEHPQLTTANSASDSDLAYFRDDKNQHFVPKLSLKDVLLLRPTASLNFLPPLLSPSLSCRRGHFIAALNPTHSSKPSYRTGPLHQVFGCELSFALFES